MGRAVGSVRRRATNSRSGCRGLERQMQAISPGWLFTSLVSLKRKQLRGAHLGETSWNSVSAGPRERHACALISPLTGTRPSLRHSAFVAVLDGSEEPRQYHLRLCRSHETHGDVFRTGIVGECGHFWHSREPADNVRDYAPELEAPSETVPAILLQGPEHFKPQMDLHGALANLPHEEHAEDQSAALEPGKLQSTLQCIDLMAR